MAAEPWIAATRPTSASRWLDESGIALVGEPIAAGAGVAGDLLKTQDPALEVVIGQASVSASLSVQQRVTGLAQGSSSVSAEIGWLYDFAVVSGGVSTVSGELTQGDVVPMSGLSAGKSTVWQPDWYPLQVDRLRYILEQEEVVRGDSPSGSSRDSGKTRPRFSPKSVGRTNSKPTWERVR